MYRFLFAGLLAGVCGSAFASSGPAPASNAWRPYIEIDARRASDAIWISQFETDWSRGFSPRTGRNVTILRANAGVGLENNDWRLGYEVRLDAWLHANREALEMVRLYKQRIHPDAPIDFPVNVRYHNWSAQGVRVGRSVDGPGFVSGNPSRWHMSAAVYGGQRYVRDEVSGSIRYLGSDDYTFNVTQQRADDRAIFPFLDEKTSAAGLSLSLAGTVPLTAALSLEMQFDDLWSRLRWRNLPVMQRTLNSDVRETDNQGYINYRPLLSGRNQHVDRNVEVSRRSRAALNYQDGNWRYGLELERYAGTNIPMVSAGYQFGWGLLSTRYESRFRTWGLDLKAGHFRLALQTDSLRSEQAKAQSLILSYRRPL